MAKWKSNLKRIKSQNVSSYYGKSWKVITIYLTIITVTIEIILKKDSSTYTYQFLPNNNLKEKYNHQVLYIESTWEEKV